jgi:hypothetical protein
LHLISSEAAKQHANAPSRDESEPCADYGVASDPEEPANLNKAVMSPTSNALSPFSPIEADEHSSPEQLFRGAANLADMMPIDLTTKSDYKIETKISVWQYIDCSLPDGFKRIDLLSSQSTATLLGNARTSTMRRLRSILPQLSERNSSLRSR